MTHPPPSTPSLRQLYEAFEVAARHVGAGLSSAPEPMDAALTADVPGAARLGAEELGGARGLSRARVQLRRVRLDGSVHGSVVPGSLVAFRSDTGAPVAVVPRGRGVWLHDPGAGVSHPLDGDWANNLRRDAWLVGPALPAVATSPAILRALLLRQARRALRLRRVTAAVAGVFPAALPLAAIAVLGAASAGGGGPPVSTTAALLLLALAAVGLRAISVGAGLRAFAAPALAAEGALFRRVLRLPGHVLRASPPSATADGLAAAADEARLVACTEPAALRLATTAALSLASLLALDPVRGSLGVGFLAVALVTRALLLRGKASRERAAASSRSRGPLFLGAALRGLPELRLAGACERVCATWAGLLAADFQRAEGAARIEAVARSIETGITFLGLAALLAPWGGYPGAWSGEPAHALAGVMAFLLAVTAGHQAVDLALSSRLADAGRLGPLLREAEEGATASCGGAFEGSVAMRGVDFGYPGAPAPTLRDVSLEIAPGEAVGIAGPSGSGKSTLLRLLLGLERPLRGEVLVDGIRIESMDPSATRSMMGAVLQDDVLAPGSIRSVLIGGSAHDLHRAWAALRTVELDAVVAAMPLGMQTFVHDGNLSASQRQRLLLARALVRRPRLLVLDEATSALDEATQASILARVRRGDGGAPPPTCVVASHRPGLLAGLDRVYRIQEGQVTEGRGPTVAGDAPAAPRPEGAVGPTADGARAGAGGPPADPTGLFRPEALGRAVLPQPPDHLARLDLPPWMRPLSAGGLAAAAAALGLWLLSL